MTKLLVRFTGREARRAHTSEVILEQGVPINILSAHMNQLGGELLIEVEERHAQKIIDAFRLRDVTVDAREQIEVNRELCIDCGACIGVCPVDAYSFKEDWKVNLDESRCLGVACMLCVDNCPQRAITLIG